MYAADLECRGDTLNLSENNAISLGPDFSLPGLISENSVSTGTSLNRSGGGRLSGKRYLDRVWTFDLRILGTNDYHALGLARKAIAFLHRHEGDELYVRWRSNADVPVPLWGQFGAWLRLRIISVERAELSDLYAANPDRDAFFLPITVRVKPAGMGNQQRLPDVSGCVIEDTIGANDFSPQGLRVVQATSNKVDTGDTLYFSSYSGDYAREYHDEAYIWPGMRGALRLTGSAFNSINVGNTNTHTISAIVKLPDGGDPSAACQIYYGVAQTTSFYSLGNGFYVAYWKGAGINASTQTGVEVADDYTVYVCSFQVEEKAYWTMPAFIGQIGCSVSGSTVVRTGGKVSVPVVDSATGDRVLQSTHGAFLVVWKADVASATTTTDKRTFVHLWSGSATLISAYFSEIDDKFHFLHGAYHATSSLQNFSAGTTFILLFSYGPTGISIQINGVTDGTAGIGQFSVGGTLYLGGDNTGGEQPKGILKGITIYRDTPTTAQSLAIYQEALALVNGGMRVDYLPWFWTRDGDGVLDNCIDNIPFSEHQWWGLAAGIPGDLPALTTVFGRVNDDVHDHLTVLPAEHYYDLSALFGDKNDTADAACVGGGYTAYTVGTSYAGVFGLASISNARLIRDLLLGREIWAWIRLREESLTTTLSVYLSVTIGGYAYNTDPVTISTGTTYKYYRLGKMRLLSPTDNLLSSLITSKGVLGNGANFYVYAKRGSGSSNIRVDFLALVPGKPRYVNGALTTFVLRGQEASDIDLNQYREMALQLGKSIELQPGQYNHVVNVHAEPGGASNPLSDWADLTWYVTPQWSIF